MKRTIFLITVACMLLVSCGNAQSSKNTPAVKQTSVYYFHGKQRCATCMAIEKNTKEAVESQFAEALKNGTLVFKIIDISEKENEAIADKYEVAFSTLLLVNHRDGKETVEDLTDFAFGNARSKPDAFKQGLTEKITALLK